jgi:hypothetical protein
MPIQSLPVQHALAHRALPRGVHPPHTLETLDCTTGSDDLAPLLLHTGVGRRPLGPPPLTHGLLQGREWRQADAFFPRRVPQRLAQGPQAGAGRTPQRVLNGLGPWCRPPIAILPRPLSTEYTPSLAPLWTWQRLGGLLPLRWRPRPLVQRPGGPQDRQRHGHPAHDAFRLHRRITGPRGLTPRGPRGRRHAAGLRAPRCARRDVVVGLCGGRSRPRSPRPCALPDALACALGMQHVAPPLAGSRGRVLLALSRRASRLPGERHPPLQPLARRGDDTRHTRPLGPHLTPTLSRASWSSLGRHPCPTVRLYGHENRPPMADDCLQTQDQHPPLTALSQPGQPPPSLPARLGDPTPDRRPTRRAPLGQENGQ